MTTLVGGRYRLDQRIATGGMGEVWRATDSVLGRQVAVKLLKAEFADDPTSRTRFEAEARNAAQLHHPGIASVFDFGEQTLESGDTTAYLVMELVDGKPLSALMRPGEPLAYAATARIVADAADAVQVAHDAGIVHRDIKPANLLVTPAGAVKVTDFGIARAGDGVPLTRTGEVIGTAYYLAPEQAEGKEATAASDVYALGVVLYECLAGYRPFDAETPVAVALAHVRQQPHPLPEEVPPSLAAVCMQAMSKDPAQRPASAADFAQAVRGWEDTSTRMLPPTAGMAGAAAAGAAVGAGAAAAGAAGEGEETPAGDGAEGGGPSTATLAQTEEEGEDTGRKRPAWLLPVLGVLALLLVIGGIFALTSLLDDEEGGTPNPGPTPDRTATSTNEPDPTQGTGEPAPTEDGGDAPQPTQDGGDAPQPTQTQEPTPTQDTQEPTPTQDTEQPTPTEDTSEPEPTQTTEESTPTPTTSAPETTPTTQAEDTGDEGTSPDAEAEEP